MENLSSDQKDVYNAFSSYITMLTLLGEIKIATKENKVVSTSSFYSSRNHYQLVSFIKDRNIPASSIGILSFIESNRNELVIVINPIFYLNGNSMRSNLLNKGLKNYKRTKASTTSPIVYRIELFNINEFNDALDCFKSYLPKI